MSQLTPMFIRQTAEGKAILLTIIDPEELGLPTEGDRFILVTSTKNIYTGNKPTMTLDLSSVLTPEEYLARADSDEESTQGMGIGHILTIPIWFIKKFKSVVEQMSG